MRVRTGTAAALTLAGVVLLSACSGGSADPTTPTAADPATDSSDATTAPPETESPSATETPTDGEETAGEVVLLGCDDLLSAETIEELNPTSTLRTEDTGDATVTGVPGLGTYGGDSVGCIWTEDDDEGGVAVSVSAFAEEDVDPAFEEIIGGGEGFEETTYEGHRALELAVDGLDVRIVSLDGLMFAVITTATDGAIDTYTDEVYSAIVAANPDAG